MYLPIIIRTNNMQNTNKDPIKNSGEKKNEPKTSIWNIEKDELDKQVNQYYRLKLHQSYRGISTLLLSFGLLFNVILQVVLNTSFQVLAIEVAFASLLIYFIYRGHRWAMGLFILSFTVNLLITSFERVLAGSFSVSSTIILVGVWVIVVATVAKAIRVENHKRKYNSPNVGVVEDTFDTSPIKISDEKSGFVAEVASVTTGQFTSKKLIIALLGLVTVVGGSLFWWYEIRVTEIKRECSWVEEKYKTGGREEYRWVSASQRQYELCLRHKGLQ